MVEKLDHFDSWYPLSGGSIRSVVISVTTGEFLHLWPFYNLEDIQALWISEL